jgi:hypothetical protein
MNRRSTLALVLAAALFTGCTRTREAENPNQPVPTSDWISSYRASIEQASPGSIVGVVNAVVAADNLASVGDVPAGSLQAKQTITFVDGSGNPLVVGQVVAVTEFGNVHVRYENPIDGRRAPQVGDVAVWLKK